MSIRRVVFVILFALILANSFFSKVSAQTSSQNFSSIQCVINNNSQTISACIASAVPLALIGIGLSFLIVGLAFMIGEVMNYRPLKSFYKTELWETTKSIAIIVIIFSTLIIAGSIAASLAGTSQPPTGGAASLSTNLASLYTTANTMYLYPQLNQAYTSFGGLLGLSVGSGVITSLQLETWFPIPIITPLTGQIGSVQFGSSAEILQTNYINSRQFSSLDNSASTLVTSMIVILQMQYDLLYVIAAIGLGVFIPIGIVMRAIPFIRGIGGTMIAIGIGMAIIYPALLVGFNLPITNYIYTLNSASLTSTCPFSIHLACTLWSGFQTFIDDIPGFVTGTVPLGIVFGKSAVTTQATMISGQGFYAGLIGPFTNGIYPELNFVIDVTLDQILQFILFILDLVIGIALMNSIAGVLGGSIKLGIGKKLRLA